MLLLLADLVWCAVGNRTHYPDGKPRNGSAEATDYSLATGTVTMLLPMEKKPSDELMAYQQKWASQNNISLVYKYLDKSDSRTNPFQAMHFCDNTEADIIWVDAISTPLIEKCFVDLWAWDFSFGSATWQTFLIYNTPYLTSHGYTEQETPKTMEDLGKMILDILEQERGAENYKLTGITSGFKGLQEIVLWAAELNHGVDGSLVDKNTGVSIVYSDHFAEVLSLIADWLGQGVMDTADVTTLDETGAINKWMRREAVFLRGTPSSLQRLSGSQYPRGTWAMPLHDENSPYGVGGLGGYYAGVHSNSTNVADAVVCAALGYNLCNTYAQSQVALRPSKQTAPLYQNVTGIISTTLLSMINGQFDLVSGLGAMDVLLREMLGNAKNNGTISTPVTTIPTTKKQLKHLESQLLGLLLFIGAIVLGIVLHRKKQEYDEQQAKKEEEQLWF
ncbi:hypothetical protein EDD86DRAFT_247988 [Gorgonomyces haynaldii]|nr:hypothetical protein EDD86DRAFT_247988 [Gorgonomyces haynaldii]